MKSVQEQGGFSARALPRREDSEGGEATDMVAAGTTPPRQHHTGIAGNLRRREVVEIP